MTITTSADKSDHDCGVPGFDYTQPHQPRHKSLPARRSKSRFILFYFILYYIILISLIYS